MCGIFGYYHHGAPRARREVLDLLLGGLARLEHRGYDSAGLAVEAVAGGGGGPAPPPLVVKAAGRVAELEARVAEVLRELGDEGGGDEAVYDAHGHAGIAHTRWATHGPPSAANAHPHSSGAFTVVHNGVVTNHRPLRAALERRGAAFKSETDTEVVPWLLEFLFAALPGPAPLVQLVLEAAAQLEGAFALLVTSTHYPGELVACRRGSPLILGVRRAGGSPRRGAAATSPDGAAAGAALECFLASDAAALVEHTRRAVVLEEGDAVALCAGAYEVFAAGAPGAPPAAAARALETLALEVAEISRGGHAHFMRKEIFEQPDSVLQTMRGRVRFAGGGWAGVDGAPAAAAAAAGVGEVAGSRVKLGGVAAFLDQLRASRRLLLVGCGSSFHAALAARGAFEELAGLPVGLELASDLVDRAAPLFRDDACVFVSQSGETADTLRALEAARAAGALCVGVTNAVGSAIARGTECGVHINAGAEVGVASTKAYTSQVVALALLALALGEERASRAARRAALADGLAALPAAIRAALALDARVAELAARLRDETSLLILGRGYNYATALEAALKVKEVARMHSEGVLAGEVKHGPLALVDESLPVLVIATADGMRAKMLSVLAQLRARRAAGKLVVLCCAGDAEAAAAAGPGAQLLEVERVPDALQPVVNIVPLQLLAYHLALARGLDVDRPRNLAKSVTVADG